MPDERRGALPSEWQPWPPCDSEAEDDMRQMLSVVEQEEPLRAEPLSSTRLKRCRSS